jgi:DNA-binding MarR family transcriptional regulator
MSSAFSPQLLGQTEKALNAFLLRELAGTGVTEPQWIALTLTAMTGGTLARGELGQRVANGLQLEEETADAHLQALVAAGLVADQEQPVLTEVGQELWSRVRAFTVAITVRLWGDLPPEDLEAAARVLTTVLDRANALLAEQ